MNRPKRIAVLQDSPQFGGHEIAFLGWLPALLASDDVETVQVRLPQSNTAFQAALDRLAHPKLDVETVAFEKGRGEPFRAPLRFRYGLHTRRLFRHLKPDIVLLLQGRIENLATPMLWLPRAAQVVSYLPMAHSSSVMGRTGRIARLGDRVKRIYYARPDRLIVVSEAVRAQAQAAGARSPIYVVENVTPSSKVAWPSKADARRQLEIDPTARIALFMGRFDPNQKGIDLLLRDLQANAGQLREWTFLFVGHGPAEPEIAQLLAQGEVRGRIVGWTPTPQLYQAASDVLLMPSRFEGVPLAMLEAVSIGLPLLAADIDVFREYLPSAMLRDFRKPVDLASALEAVTSAAMAEAYRTHAAALMSRLDPAQSRSRFVTAVLGTGVGS